MDKKIFANTEEIKKLRASKGLSQKDLAEELDFNYSWYNQAENAATPISEKRAREISNFLESSFEQLFSTKRENETTRALTQRARQLSSDAEVCEFIKLKDFESVVSNAISMLKRAKSFWYGSGVTASWIKRNGVGDEFKGKIETALSDDVDFRILLNNSIEVLLAENTSSRLLYSAIENNDLKKLKKLQKKAEEKLVEYIDAYLTKVDGKKKELLKHFKVFPHGDIRTFISDSNEVNGDKVEELMMVIDHPPIGGGHQRRWYTGLVIRDNEIAKDFKYRFDSIWDFSADPTDILEGVENSKDTIEE